MKKGAIIKLAALLVLVIYTISCSLGNQELPQDGEDLTRSLVDTVVSDSLVIDTLPLPETINLVAVGDIMMGTDYPNTRTLPPEDGATLFEGVKEYLMAADLTFGNLEGAIGRGGVAKRCNNPSQCYTFRMPARYTNHLKNAGFDVVSIANNHANDFAEGGRKASAAVLDTSGLHYAGSKEKPYTIFEHGGLTYGFLAAAPNSGCFDMKEYKAAADYVRMLDSLCDIVFVSFHAGAEGAKARHTPRKDEYFLGNNRGNVYKFAHDCIDAGADVLLGHGPHVTRAAELYNGRFIIYSMGNFCTYEKFSLKGSKGVGPIISLKLTRDGAFLGGKVIPTKQLGEGIPVYDPSKRALNELIELSLADFEESPLLIDSMGNLSVKPNYPIPADNTEEKGEIEDK